ncbi:hypothetical protein MFIFM68171_02537 [Madurella fahalii]|uniref:Uncharacterized protein n=1 Tax=Madurella fahalii TaxID=1157608 RepID=A0ABQ0G3L2_9PEZI
MRRLCRPNKALLLLSNLPSKTRQLRTSLVLYIVALTFTVACCYYAHQALLNPNPTIGDFWLSAANANLFISILSLTISSLVAYLLPDALNQLQWALASRPSGISMPILAILSSGTQWHAVAIITLRNMRSPIALATGLLRLGLPLSGIFFGSILKFGATFDYHFQGRLAPVAVYSGAALLDASILSFIRPSRVNMYFQTLTPMLLSDDLYAVAMPAPDCEEKGCTSLFLPGGLGTVRVIDGPAVNITLMEGKRLGTSDTVQVQNAPGRLLRFKSLSMAADFDRDSECKVYGQGGDDAIQICIKQEGPSLTVGWAACPSRLKDEDEKLCFTEKDWMAAPIN